MTQQTHREYLLRRQRESSERASGASDPALVRVYRDFAEGYARRLRDLSPEG